MTSQMPQYIYINGYPGIGKLTVANELSKLVPRSKVYHNHLLIDPVAAMVDRGSPHYDAMRTSFRRFVLDILAASEATRDTTWIFTDSRCTSQAGSTAAKDFQNAAAKRGVPFISVVLECQLEENLKRVAGEGRDGAGCTKLTDTEVLKHVRREEEIFRFGLKSELSLDITSLTPPEAARRVYEHIDNAVVGTPES